MFPVQRIFAHISSRLANKLAGSDPVPYALERRFRKCSPTLKREEVSPPTRPHLRQSRDQLRLYKGTFVQRTHHDHASRMSNVFLQLLEDHRVFNMAVLCV